MDVEWLMLADSADVVNNKLYLLGGGWETLTVGTELPLVHPFAIAMSVLIPWDEIDQTHVVEVEIGRPDGESLAIIGSQIEVGQPAGTQLGSAQRVQVAYRMALGLKEAGTYVVKLRVEGEKEERRRVEFSVIEGPSARQPPPNHAG